MTKLVSDVHGAKAKAPRTLQQQLALERLCIGSKGDHTIEVDQDLNVWVRRGSKRVQAEYTLRDYLIKSGSIAYDASGRLTINWSAVPRLLLQHCTIIVTAGRSS